MSLRFPKLGRTSRGILLGVLAALIAGAAHWTGLDRKAELYSLDLRFRHLPTLEPSDRIVHVDLDDHALQVVGHWPWHRQRLAELVETLADCGARAVALDIILPEPQEPRFVKEGVTDLYSGNTTELLEDAPPVPVLDDVELAAALAGHKNVYLGMHVDIGGGKDALSEPERLAVSISTLAATRPALTREEAARALGKPMDVVGLALIPGKQLAFEKIVAAALEANPGLSLQDIARQLLGTAESRSDDMDVVRRVYLRRRALDVVEHFALPASDVARAPATTGRPMPPLVTLARAVSHIGHVTSAPDDDGIVRRIPLLMRTEEGVFPQMGLALAAAALAEEHGGSSAITGEPGTVVITCHDGSTRRIPVDDKGNMRINWVRLEHNGLGHKHISATIAADVWTAREALDRNQAAFRKACLKLANLFPLDLGTKLQELMGQDDKLWAELNARRLARQTALLFAPGNVPDEAPAIQARADETDKLVEIACRSFLAEFDTEYARLAKDAAAQPATSSAPAEEDPELVKMRKARLLIRQLQDEQAALARQAKEATARLSSEVAGKYCFVGSNATAAADFAPTPVHARMPGVQLHSNIMETILSGRFVRESDGLVSALVVLLTSLIVAFLTSTRDARVSAALLLTAGIAYAAIDGAVWRQGAYWLVAAAPLMGMLMAFTAVTVYRQLTEERQRRQITSTFKEYVPPDVVDQLARDPSLAKLGGQQRVLSHFFSDLAGFTSLSERLGAEGTVVLLNRYLDRVGEILSARYRGTLSKYEGDAVYVFFGAPLPQEDHAARAIRAALDCQAFLPEFNAQMRSEGLLPAGDALASRIGITTGVANVGNMGSTAKKAYTAIGDSVNLASRLETANKFFGSRTMVNGDAWRAGGAGVVGRPLGRIIVVGKAEPVEVWEPLALEAAADGKLRDAAGTFAKGVEFYSQGKFEEARECFLTAMTILPEDRPSEVYVGLCEQAIDNPPTSVDFDGVIRLTEK